MKKRMTSLFIIIGMLISFIPALKANAATANIIKIGDYVQMGKYYDEPILWRCVDIDGNGPLMLSDRSLAIKAFDAKGNHNLDPNAPEDSRSELGSNLWATSNMRSWLNSTASAGNVKWLDGCPPIKDNLWNGLNAYADEKGFLAEGNFSENERNAIKSVSQKSLLNGVDEDLREGGIADHVYNENIKTVVQNYDTAYYHMVTDKVFLLDVKQLNKVYQNGSVLGINYYQSKPTQKALDKSEYKNVALTTDVYLSSWSRTPYADIDSKFSVRYISNETIVDNMNALIEELGVRPAFYINLTSEFLKSGNGSVVTPYVVNSESTPTNVIPEKLNVNKNKKWNIKLNSSINLSDINNSNIYVVDKNGDIFPTRVYQDTTDYKVICVQPVNEYLAKERYTLWIKELKSIDGKKVLKKNVKMSFIIGN